MARAVEQKVEGAVFGRKLSEFDRAPHRSAAPAPAAPDDLHHRLTPVQHGGEAHQFLQAPTEA
ncbi:MAG: hypothetical protein WDN69_14135 [Aliidongia sp.]